MALQSSKRLTGVVVAAWVVALVHGCGSDFTSAGNGSDAGEATDSGVSDSTARADTGNPDGSALDSGMHDGGTLDGSATDTGAPDTGEDTGADAADAGCPQPHPMTCGTIINCPCVDGTTQIGGCPNGFTCPQACCGHGGST